MAPPARRPTGRTRLPGPWKNGPIPVIGLVGGIGSGKTTVATRLAELGAFVIDADTVGHTLLNQPPVREQVIDRFGAQILDAAVEPDEEPAIDRRALGAIVFADPLARKALEDIVHPRMRHTFEKAAARVARRGEAPAVVLDAAILYEAGWDSLCDRVVFVDAPRDARVARVAAERGWSESTLAAREQAQWPLDRKRDRADVVILNAGGLDALRDGVARVLEDVLASPPKRVRPPRDEAAATPDRGRRTGPSPGRRGRPRSR
jgi:dephospho-CoA kinase